MFGHLSKEMDLTGSGVADLAKSPVYAIMTPNHVERVRMHWILCMLL